MTDTVVITDNFNGGAGTLDGHTPDVQTTGVGAYDTPSHMSLDGSGRTLRNTVAGFPIVRGTIINPALGVYWEVEYIAGSYGGAGIQSLFAAFTIDSGDMPTTTVSAYGPDGTGFPTKINEVWAGSSNSPGGDMFIEALPGGITAGTTVLLRGEVDPYAKHSKLYLNGSLILDQDDASWYYGTELFLPSTWSLYAQQFSTYPGPGGSSENLITRFTAGTLGLAALSPPFWCNYQKCFEVDG